MNKSVGRNMQILLLAIISLISATSLWAITYTYDDLNRLTSVQYAADKMISYSYDEVGNIVEMVIITPDAPNLDSNSNGIPDVWELSSGLQLDFPPGHDHDGDGLIDTDEYPAGTDPSDSNSVFGVVSISNFTARAFSFDSVASRFYSLDYCTNLQQQNWLPVSGATDLPGSGTAENLSDTNAVSPPVYYRLRVRWP